MNRFTTRWLLAIMAATLFASGCHRSFYRQQADLEAYHLIGEKAVHPHWDLTDYSIEPNPLSRMADLNSADCPPMPLDDPNSHEFMHVVDRKPGYPFWDVNGQTMFVENEQWQSFLPLDEEGALRLNKEDAVRLALLHSPNYQTQLENLYLSALDVSAERFVFDPQYTGGYALQYDALGRLHPSAGGSSTSTFSASTTNIQMRRFFTTGAELVVGLANSLVWQFSGADTHSASTLVNFSLVQPLLRNAGRDKILESLTLAERNLLAGVRQMERFRRGFYLDIVYGNGAQSGPGNVNSLNGQFGVNPGNAGGLLGLLQTQLSIRNQEANLDALRSSLTQIEAAAQKDTGDGGFFQVDRTRQNVTTSTTALLNSKRAYRDQLDAFKRDLGLPPKLKVVIDDDTLDVVNLVDPDIQGIQDVVKDLRHQASLANIAILEEFRKGEDFGWSEDLQRSLLVLKARLADLNVVCADVVKNTTATIRREIADLQAAIPKRKQFSQEIRAKVNYARDLKEDSLTSEVDLSIYTQKLYGLRKMYADQTQHEIDLDELPQYLLEWLAKVEERLGGIMKENVSISQALDQVLDSGSKMEKGALMEFVNDKIQKPNPDQFNLSEANMIELILITAMARAEKLVLPPVELTSEEAIRIASMFRRDWMNARASLVDNWRQIEFNADDLESILDIVFEGGIRNTGDNPLRLRDAAGNLGVGLQFDAPLTRLLERNQYRATLIRYQQARRAFYQIDDAISQSMRSILRRVEYNKVDFEVRRTALRLAISQVRSARLAIVKPPDPNRAGQVARPLGPTASRDLTDSLSALNRAQDDFIGVWVDFEILRGLLDLQMGTMRLDQEGLWIDPGAIGPKLGYPTEEQMRDVPEYQDAFPSLDELLYGEPDQAEEIPKPDVQGPINELPNPRNGNGGNAPQSTGIETGPTVRRAGFEDESADESVIDGDNARLAARKPGKSAGKSNMPDEEDLIRESGSLAESKPKLDSDRQIRQPRPLEIKVAKKPRNPLRADGFNQAGSSAPTAADPRGGLPKDSDLQRAEFSRIRREDQKPRLRR